MGSRGDVCRAIETCDPCITSGCVWTASFWFPCRENEDESDSRVFLQCNTTTQQPPEATTFPSVLDRSNNQDEWTYTLVKAVWIFIAVLSILMVVAILLKSAFGQFRLFQRKNRAEDQRPVILEEIASGGGL